MSCIHHHLTLNVSPDEEFYYSCDHCSKNFHEPVEWLPKLKGSTIGRWHSSPDCTGSIIGTYCQTEKCTCKCHLPLTETRVVDPEPSNACVKCWEKYREIRPARSGTVVCNTCDPEEPKCAAHHPKFDPRCTTCCDVIGEVTKRAFKEGLNSAEEPKPECKWYDCPNNMEVQNVQMCRTHGDFRCKPKEPEKVHKRQGFEEASSEWQEMHKFFSTMQQKEREFFVAGLNGMRDMMKKELLHSLEFEYRYPPAKRPTIRRGWIKALRSKFL